MKKKKIKYFAAIMAIILFTGIFLPVLEASMDVTYQDVPLMDKQTAENELLIVEDNSYEFKDIAKYWARDEILELSYMGIMKGYGDKTMQPDRTISREEFVAMLVRALSLTVDDNFRESYKDVTDKHWSHKYVAAAKEHGLLAIFGGYYFYPYKEITREEMAVITANAVKNADITREALNFKDIPKYYKYKESIDKVTALGIFTGLPDGSFNPKGSATRAQAAAVIGRVLKTREAFNEVKDSYLISLADEYEKSVITALNGNDLKFGVPLSLSTGKEAGLNGKRADQFGAIYSKGLVKRKHIENQSFNVLGKSGCLAEIEASYELVFEDDSSRYLVKKTIYLKNSGDKWTVYNNVPELSNSTVSGGKINLTWHYIGGSSPDMSGVKKVEGLNVISPTWFTLADEKGGLEDRGSHSYVSWAHRNGYKVWALVDNKFNSALTSKFINNAGARTKFIKSLVSSAEKYKIDGINIDFENMYINDKNAFTRFLEELYAKTKEKGLILSVDVSVIVSNSNWSESFDRAAIARTSDYVALMAYDQHWEGSPVSGSVAQLSWVEQCLKRVLQEVPREKLILGVPFYTRLWKEEYAKGSSKPVVTSKAISMETAERIIKENKAEKNWDAVSGQCYATYKDGNAIYKIWLEDERSIELKARLVDKYGLGGIASWKYGLEKQTIWSVIAKIIS